MDERRWQAGERRYAIAYRNDSTKGEWVMLTRGDGLIEGCDAFREIKGDYIESASDLALFSYRPGDDWRDGHISRAVWNWPNKPIGSAFAGLINSLESDWF